MNGLRETQVGTIVGVEAEARPAMQCPYGATEIQQEAGRRRQEAGGESVLLVDVILESSGKRQPRNAPQGGGKAITTTTTTNTIAVKLLQFLGQLKSTFLATITFRHQFEEREKGMTRGGGERLIELHSVAGVFESEL